MAGDDLDAREAALEGAYLAGTAFADAGSGLHHKLCHVLGGLFDLPHAATHTVLLPHVVRFQREAAPEAMTAIARALGVLDPVLGMERLARTTGAPLSLEKLGMPREGIAKAVDAALRAPALAGLDQKRLTAMLEAAWSGPEEPGEAPPLRAPEALGHQSGLGSTHESEALPDALPKRQNMPHPAPYGLLIECVNGTPFTVKSAENSRVFMYRIRASFSHDELVELPAARFCAELGAVDPNRRRWQPMPIPDAPTDFLDGLVTLGGTGDPTAGPGFQVHLYAANSDMVDRCFADADGDLLIVPQEGTLHCRTELGWLSAAPGTVLLIPRALKFAIGLPDGKARGFDSRGIRQQAALPERGPIGSNGLADARHFLAPVAVVRGPTLPGGLPVRAPRPAASYSPGVQQHSPFDVVAWHGNHAPFTYDLLLFNAMGSVTFDHADPSILTALTAPLDDHGRAICRFRGVPAALADRRAQLPPALHAPERRDRGQHGDPDRARRGLRPRAGLRHSPAHRPRHLHPLVRQRSFAASRRCRTSRRASATTRSGSCSSRRCRSARPRGRVGRRCWTRSSTSCSPG